VTIALKYSSFFLYAFAFDCVTARVKFYFCFLLSINPHDPYDPKGTIYLYNGVYDNKDEKEKKKNRKREKLRVRSKPQ